MATTAFAAGTLPLPAFALTALTAWLAIGAFRWWSELASDAHALRTCGRALLVGMWSADLAEARTMPRALRFWHTLCALRMHPPLHLRRWFARRAPLSLPASGHPLTTTPGITPVRSAPGE
ncbi:hypothetical protein [Streptomyces sp. PA03-2a]|uniref:hypothetical protein n=1 Tax=Streptomyces sp. PA03-2a TaxID=3028701 RepID=UPI0029B24743|nr:hypothetical protein [Streptomyces sp. PA03-2a]MDX2733464.1 hypothetical protein [Streptomyces sp. PA03-2a]